MRHDVRLCIGDTFQFKSLRSVKVRKTYLHETPTAFQSVPGKHDQHFGKYHGRGQSKCICTSIIRIDLIIEDFDEKNGIVHPHSAFIRMQSQIWQSTSEPSLGYTSHTHGRCCNMYSWRINPSGVYSNGCRSKTVDADYKSISHMTKQN